jgi:uncharacterized protein YfaA (DUF2138 family)
MSISKKNLFWLFIVAGTIALGSVMLRPPPPFRGPVDHFAPDIARPDALIRSYSLSRLPADLLRIPLARDVLTEDFVSYYEQNEERQALSGTVRRLAFEHKLDLPERLIESALDEPAEVALWRGGDGRLRHFAIVLSRNALARVIQTLLPAVSRASDLQLFSAGTLDGTDVDILALEYGLKYRLLLLSKGDRIVALSNPGMLFEPGGDQPLGSQSADAAEVVRELLEGKSLSPFARHFHLEKPLSGKKHELMLGSRAFAFGYEAFAPGLMALRLNFDNQGDWQSSALFNGVSTRDAGLWAKLPYGPSLCVLMPVDWTRIESLLDAFSARYPLSKEEITFINRFDGPAAVCWYKDSRLFTPLFAARLSRDVDEKQAEAFFKLAAQATRVDKGNTEFNKQTGFALWQGEIPSRYGASVNGEPRSLKPALALGDRTVFFSPDIKLVMSALDVAAKRYPSIFDGIEDRGARRDTLAFIVPQALADLLSQEVFTALPRNEENLFRSAADAYLLPRLQALARHPAQRIRLSPRKSDETPEWRVLEWEPVRTTH